MEVLHKWVMSSHDVVVKVRQEAWNGNPGVFLHVWMVWTETQWVDREMNSRTCAVTRLPGLLMVSRHLLSGPKSSCLFLVLDLLREFWRADRSLARWLVYSSLDVLNGEEEAWRCLRSKDCPLR